MTYLILAIAFFAVALLVLLFDDATTNGADLLGLVLALAGIACFVAALRGAPA